MVFRVELATGGILRKSVGQCRCSGCVGYLFWHVDDVPVVIASLVIYSVAGGDFVHKANKKMKIWLGWLKI